MGTEAHWLTTQVVDVLNLKLLPPKPTRKQIFDDHFYINEKER